MSTDGAFPRDTDRALAQLHAAGWSVGDIGGFTADGEQVWTVSGTKGGRSIVAHASTRAGAWLEALRQAESGEHNGVHP